MWYDFGTPTCDTYQKFVNIRGLRRRCRHSRHRTKSERRTTQQNLSASLQLLLCLLLRACQCMPARSQVSLRSALTFTSPSPAPSRFSIGDATRHEGFRKRGVHLNPATLHRGDRIVQHDDFVAIRRAASRRRRAATCRRSAIQPGTCCRRWSAPASAAGPRSVGRASVRSHISWPRSDRPSHPTCRGHPPCRAGAEVATLPR